MSAVFNRVRKLRAEEQRLLDRLIQVRKNLHAAENKANDALGYRSRLRGPQLLNAIDRAEAARAEKLAA